MKKISVVLATLMLAACASTPKTTSAPQPEMAQQPEMANTRALSAADIEARRLAEERAQLQALQQQSVYFDFDQFSVKPEFKGTIQQQADFIKSHSKDVVTLEGNADERGSQEYNLALGDKRADAVRKSLEMLGVPAGSLKTSSYGEEKPRLSCHEERCWKENRRVDFAHKLN